MATHMAVRYFSLQNSLLSLRRRPEILSSANELLVIRSSSSLSGKRHNDAHDENEPHTNAAALETGVTMYFNNRNPRSLELLGVAEKPKGFSTTNKRVDYYHR